MRRPCFFTPSDSLVFVVHAGSVRRVRGVRKFLPSPDSNSELTKLGTNKATSRIFPEGNNLPERSDYFSQITGFLPKK
jgi:hypothetical protein